MLYLLNEYFPNEISKVVVEYTIPLYLKDVKEKERRCVYEPLDKTMYTNDNPLHSPATVYFNFQIKGFCAQSLLCITKYNKPYYLTQSQTEKFLQIPPDLYRICSSQNIGFIYQFETYILPLGRLPTFDGFINKIKKFLTLYKKGTHNVNNW